MTTVSKDIVTQIKNIKATISQEDFIKLLEKNNFCNLTEIALEQDWNIRALLILRNSILDDREKKATNCKKCPVKSKPMYMNDFNTGGFVTNIYKTNIDGKSKLIIKYINKQPDLIDFEKDYYNDLLLQIEIDGRNFIRRVDRVFGGKLPSKYISLEERHLYLKWRLYFKNIKAIKNIAELDLGDDINQLVIKRQVDYKKINNENYKPKDFKEDVEFLTGVYNRLSNNKEKTIK